MNSGDGVGAQIGGLKVQNVLLVLGPEGSSTASLIGRITAVGADSDMLVDVNVGDSSVAAGTVSMTGVSAILPGFPVSLGYNSDSSIGVSQFGATVSTYVPVRMFFKNAGLLTLSVLTVPATGVYAGIEPVIAPAPVASVAAPSPGPAN